MSDPTPPSTPSPPSPRYARQTLLPQVGPDGQQRLAASRVLLIGVGALGCTVADLLARAGVGRLSLVDRDIVEESNLQRQTLFATSDVGEPKAEAAAGRLRQVNPTINVTPLTIDLNAGNILDHVAGADLIIEATDNAATRYLVNDASLETGKPWVYGGAVGTEGRVTGFRPGHSNPCLRCLFPMPPFTGELPTCDTAGVLNSATTTIGALQAQIALRMLIEPTWTPGTLVSIEFWTLALRTISTTAAGGCETCVGGRREFLHAPTPPTVSLCGRDTLQVLPPKPTRLDLAALERRLATIGTVQRSRFLLRATPAELNGGSATIFPDGRLLLHGLTDLAGARSWYDRLIGT